MTRHDTNTNSESTDSSSNRRRFLAASALLGTGAFATPVGAVGDYDDDKHDDDKSDDDEMPPQDGQFRDDVDILNFARTLEFLEARFYREGLDTIGEQKLLDSDTVRQFGDPIRNCLVSDLRQIQRHEEEHAELLGNVVTDLGGEPVPEPEFDFGTAVENPDEFIATAAVLEDTGVGAYAGAAPEIQNPQLVPPALGIHSVEARHASFVRVVGGEIGFPNVVDQPLSRSEVEQRAGQFIVGE